MFIQMAPGAAATDLPVSLYESVIDMVNLQVIEQSSWLKQPTRIVQARMLFVKLPYTLATEEAERIGLDHVARLDLNGVKIYTGCIKLVVSRLYLKPHKYHILLTLF